MLARHCSTCSIDWPNNQPEYGRCPKCEGHTDLLTDGNPLDLDEARSLANHHKFERYWERRERAHVAELERIPTAKRPTT